MSFRFRPIKKAGTDMEKSRKRNTGLKPGRIRAMILSLAMMSLLSALLMCSCITINTPQSAPQTEQSTDVSEDAGGSTAGDTASDGSGAAAGTGSEDLISEAEAISIVLERVPGATADEITSLRLGRDDGMPEYEGKLLHGGLEYEFEIDAANGNLLEWEIDD